MIRLTRLNHQPITLNADAIQWVESSPDTVITLVNGEKLVVREGGEEVSRAVLRYQRRKYARTPSPRISTRRNGAR